MNFWGRHKHTRVRFHSFKHWSNTVEVIGNCLQCGRSLSLHLGPIAGMKDQTPAAHKVYREIMTARGWAQDTADSEVWTR